MLQTTFGTESPSELMEKFYQAGNSTLLALRNYVTSPEDRKKPRTWSATESANMVKVSSPTFRKLIQDHPNINGIIGEPNANGRVIKKYTLEAINQLRKIAGTNYVRPEGSEPLILAVSNFKGGVGKTETAVDLSKKLAIEGLRALLIDFDAQATATLISSGLIPDLELKYEDTITTCLVDDPNLIHEKILHTHFDGLDLIPANLAIQDCDLLLPNSRENNQARLGSPYLRLSKSLEAVKDKYDVFVIDCGPNLGSLTLNAIVACNGILVPIPPSMSDYSSFVMYTASLRNLFNELDGKVLDYFRIVLTKHNGSNEALQMENMMREQFGKFMLSNHMCETVEVSKAANEIGTIYDVSRPRGSREAYRRALQHLDDLNLEIIRNFKEIWQRQSIQLQKEGDLNEQLETERA